MVITLCAIVTFIFGFLIGKRSSCDLNFEISFNNGSKLFFMGGKTKAEVMRKISNLFAEIRQLEEKEEYAELRAKTIDDLLYHLSDFMHNIQVFEKFSKEELCELFASLKDLSNYHGFSQASTTEIIAFIVKLQEEMVPRLYQPNQQLATEAIRSQEG